MNTFNKITAGLLLILFSPFLAILCIFVKLSSNGSFLFRQQRMGKDKRTFTIYKIRTMVKNAQSLQKKFAKLNQVDGPVFKIHNDPRYTKIGKILSHTAFDELPQLMNIVKGEMAFVGPRPLPVDEAKSVPRKYQKRFDVLPGMTSPWLIKGGHKLGFDKWMKSDLSYIKKKSFFFDIVILSKTVLLILKLCYYQMTEKQVGISYEKRS